MFGIVANVINDRVLRTGAKVWIRYCNGDAANPLVFGLNKSGKMVRKYTAYKRLENFRAAWIPEHLRDDVAWQWESKEDACEFANKLSTMWAGVRQFSRDGKEIVRDGVTESEAFQRAR